MTVAFKAGGGFFKIHFWFCTSFILPLESLEEPGSPWLRPPNHWIKGKRVHFDTEPLCWCCSSVSRRAGRVSGRNRPGWYWGPWGIRTRSLHPASAAETGDPRRPSPWMKPWRRWQDGSRRAPTGTCRLFETPAAGRSHRPSDVRLFAGWTAAASPPRSPAPASCSSLTGPVTCTPERGSLAAAKWPRRGSTTGRPKSGLSPSNLPPDPSAWPDLSATFHPRWILIPTEF